MIKFLIFFEVIGSSVRIPSELSENSFGAHLGTNWEKLDGSSLRAVKIYGRRVGSKAWLKIMKFGGFKGCVYLSSFIFLPTRSFLRPWLEFHESFLGALFEFFGCLKVIYDHAESISFIAQSWRL